MPHFSDIGRLSGRHKHYSPQGALANLRLLKLGEFREDCRIRAGGGAFPARDGSNRHAAAQWNRPQANIATKPANRNVSR